MIIFKSECFKVRILIFYQIKLIEFKFTTEIWIIIMKKDNIFSRLILESI